MNFIADDYKLKCAECDEVWHSRIGFMRHKKEKDSLIEFEWNGENNEYFDSGGKFYKIELELEVGLTLVFAQDRFGEWWRIIEDEMIFIDRLISIMQSRLNLVKNRCKCKMDFEKMLKWIIKNWEKTQNSFGDWRTWEGNEGSMILMNLDGIVYFNICEWRKLPPVRDIGSLEKRVKMQDWVDRMGILIEKYEYEILKERISSV